MENDLTHSSKAFKSKSYAIIRNNKLNVNCKFQIKFIPKLTPNFNDYYPLMKSIFRNGCFCCIFTLL